MSEINRTFRIFAIGFAVAALCGSATQAQIKLDPAWRVTPDTAKPGFNWNYYQNQNGSRGDSIARAESDLAGLRRDGSGLLPNLGDPNAFNVATGPATPASPANATLHFEIAGVINLSKVDGDKGNFPADGIEPGVNATDPTDGQAAEITTYLTLPVGVITMGINSDDGFSTATGPDPRESFGRVELGSYNGGRGADDTLFTFEVTEAGTYPFRTVWENGGGDSNIEWFTVLSDATSTNKVLVNDTANGGIHAYRAATGGASTLPYVKAVSPAAIPRQLAATSRNVTVVLVDGAKPVKDDSVKLQIDGKSVATVPQRQGSLLTLDTGVIDGLQLAGEAHTAVLSFSDTGTYSRTQSWTFYNLANLILPATPAVSENFDSYPEATSAASTVPPGWTATNHTFLETPGWDLTDITSDAFVDWVLVSTNTVQPLEKQVLDNDQSQLLNGQPVTNWMSGNLLFAASDGRRARDDDGNKVGQIQFVISKPFNLSTVTNPVLTFASGLRISGNVEANALEYSVDGGVNWLPAAYYQNASTLKFAPDGSYDAVAIFNTVDTNNIALYPTPGVGPLGGSFGAGILAPVSQALAPFIAERTSGIESRKIEAIRLTAAGKKSDVRLRFSHWGACGWEWGVDNIAFYDIAPATSAVQPTITGITSSGGQISIQWTGGGTLESTPSLTTPAWTSTGNSTGSFSEALPASGNKFYRVHN